MKWHAAWPVLFAVFGAACGPDEAQAPAGEVWINLHVPGAIVASNTKGVVLKVVGAGDGCTARPLVQRESSVLSLSSRSSQVEGPFDLGFQGMYGHFALPAGTYRLCAELTFSAVGGAPICENSTSVVDVVEGSRTEIVLASRCRLPAQGGELSPLPVSVSVLPGRMVTAGDVVTLEAKVDSVEVNSRQFSWSVLPFRDGRAATLHTNGRTATLTVPMAGEYFVDLSVDDGTPSRSTMVLYIVARPDAAATAAAKVFPPLIANTSLGGQRQTDTAGSLQLPE